MSKEIEIEISNIEFWITLAFLIVLAYWTFQVTVPTNIVFGDEGFHTTLARWIGTKLEYPKYIPFEGTNLRKTGYYRPPLWNLLEASFFAIFGNNELIPKILNPVITFLTGLSIFILTFKIFRNEKLSLFASILTVSLPTILTYTVFFYYANLLVFFSTLSILLFFDYVKNNSWKSLILSSLFASLAFLTNQAGLALYLLILIWFLKEVYENRRLKNSWIISIFILIIVPLGFFVRNLVVYKAPVCYSIPYLGKFWSLDLCNINEMQEKYKFKGQAIPTGTEQNVFRFGLMNYLSFVYGNLLFTFLPFIFGFSLIYLRKEKIFIPLSLFLLFLLILFPKVSSRAEDTARYTILWASTISFVAAFFYEYISQEFEKSLPYSSFIIILIVLILASYYSISKLNSLKPLKYWSISFIQACKWISQNLPENSTISTIWAHNAAFYSNRRIAGFYADIALSNDLNYTLKFMKENGIDYLFIQKFSIDPLNRGYADNYPSNFVKMIINHPNIFVKVYENGPPLENCLNGNCDGNVIYYINYTAAGF
ncbi:MAG: hypothetical protein B6U78_02290 [Candidatus Aenigmarchaeota archaeon ex4484_224]|nr:MAG: hypothetical protein B6U78_02290 [Candidatus Aenigmarchaeota archaeon ex4484_224]